MDSTATDKYCQVDEWEVIIPWRHVPIHFLDRIEINNVVYAILKTLGGYEILSISRFRSEIM